MEIKQLGIEELKIISNNFKQELQDAQAGKKTSLAFIIHELSPSPIVKDGEIFQTLVIGGTIGIIATLKKNNNAIQILDKKEKKLSFKTGEEFLDYVNQELQENIKTLALNFAYPIKPVFEKGKLDGTLLTVTKEGGFHGLIGKQIGREIEKYILAKRNIEIRVAVANDTVCLLTSGLSQFKQDGLAGGIVGTGLNFAFFLDKVKLVNLESANFDKFPQTELGRKVDEVSSRPGKSLFEKETAGAYLYQGFKFALKENDLDYPNIASTEELDRTSRANIPQVSRIAQSLLKKSAQLVACQITGITLFKKQNMIFNMEGSLFWKGNEYKETVAETVRQLAPQYKIDFVEIEDSAILGAAKLIS
ncbi:MAG: Hexokinase 2 protein [Candidatus Levybacteria bacterium]|nr:Hexokinase 2 protein [Candidatus Levybacteria bacterium]